MKVEIAAILLVGVIGIIGIYGLPADQGVTGEFKIAMPPRASPPVAPAGAAPCFCVYGGYSPKVGDCPNGPAGGVGQGSLPWFDCRDRCRGAKAVWCFSR